MGSEFAGMPLKRLALGRREGTMNQSQENCLLDNHRCTHERWGGDLTSICLLAVFALPEFRKGFSLLDIVTFKRGDCKNES